MQNAPTEQIARELGYTSEWLAWGVVDEAYLRAQYDLYTRDDDKNQEHYRCAAFRDFLCRQLHVTDDLIDKVFRLTDDGPDRCDLRRNRICELLLSGCLSDEQHFALAQRHPEVHEPPLQKVYQRESLLRKIRRSGVAANFAEIQAYGDRDVQLALLEHAELEREQLVWLAEHGANKAIRNRAGQRLRTDRFRLP